MARLSFGAIRDKAAIAPYGSADNIIEDAGGVAPNVSGAWQQNYGE